MKYEQDESTGLLVDDCGRTVDVRPQGTMLHTPSPAEVEALANWHRTYDPHYIRHEFSRGGHSG